MNLLSQVGSFAVHALKRLIDACHKWNGIGTKSIQNTSAYEEPRSSVKQLCKYSFDPRSIH